MRSKALNTAIAELDLLSEEIKKQRNNRAFNKFINTRIDYAKEAIQPLTDDIALSSVKKVHDNGLEKTNSLETQKEEDGVIKTEEICSIPYPFVQSETLLYPDGRKVFTSFFPTNERIPAKRIETSADGRTQATTNFDRNGKEKTFERITKNIDGSGIEEKIEYKYSRKVVRSFNPSNITKEVKSFINDKLAFKLVCDEKGNILKECTYYAFSPNELLQKEVIYTSKNSYSVKEYNLHGQVRSAVTMKK